MILEHALPPVKPGQEADFEPAVAKAKAGSGPRLACQQRPGLV